MGKTNLPSMTACDGCKDQPVIAACCTIVRTRPLEAKAIRRYAKEHDIQWQVNDDIQCGFLQDGQCSIYEVRPWMCRAFGVIKQAPCSRFPEEAQLDLPPAVVHSLKLSDPDDAFLGWYFEPGYYDRIKHELAPHGYNLEVV